MEEGHAESLLRFREPPGDRRTVDAEHPGGRRKRALLADCEDDPKVVPANLAARSIQGIAPFIIMPPPPRSS
jgi:hypothetical protein